jgi:hypothetical protein
MRWLRNPWDCLHFPCSNVCYDVFLSLILVSVRPLEVTLLGSNQPMSALQEIEIVCQSVGSRPPAEISWYKDGHHLQSSREEVNHLYYSLQFNRDFPLLPWNEIDDPRAAWKEKPSDFIPLKSTKSDGSLRISPCFLSPSPIEIFFSVSLYYTRLHYDNVCCYLQSFAQASEDIYLVFPILGKNKRP